MKGWKCMDGYCGNNSGDDDDDDGGSGDDRLKSQV